MKRTLCKQVNICALHIKSWLFSVAQKKSHEFGTIEIPKSACFAQLKQKENL